MDVDKLWIKLLFSVMYFDIYIYIIGYFNFAL